MQTSVEARAFYCITLVGIKVPATVLESTKESSRMKGRKIIRGLSAIAIVAYLTAASANPIETCKDMFIGSDSSNAPTLYSSSPTSPYRQNVHLCFQTDTPYFALEYWPSRYSPAWVAYKLDKNYGANGCDSIPRKHMRCYFNTQDQTKLDECIEKIKNGGSIPGDPFHADPTLNEGDVQHLKANAFFGTGHDRGHMAPNNAFSGDMCASYNTFTMANMSPQFGYLNRYPWRKLERQVLYWVTTKGPIYVVTGPVFNRFPANKFDYIKNGKLDKYQIYKSKRTLRTDQGRRNHPKIRMPTGYFKVIYKPAVEDEPAHAIGFLLPHTQERYNDFWPFITRIDLIEEKSRVSFGGIPKAMKKGKGQLYWLEDRVSGSWNLRRGCDNKFNPKQWLKNKILEERLAVCEQ